MEGGCLANTWLRVLIVLSSLARAFAHLLFCSPQK